MTEQMLMILENLEDPLFLQLVSNHYLKVADIESHMLATDQNVIHN